MTEYNNEEFDEVCRSFVTAMQRVVERIKNFTSSMNTLVFKVYEDAGCPYGKSPAGFQLWIEDQNRHFKSLNQRKN